MYQIESILSSRLFIAPQLVNGRIYFFSNLSGRLSLYAMDYGGSVPEPLLPPYLALPNPHLMGGEPFLVFPKLGKILVMLDSDGDEHYQPMVIPIEGGFPKPIFENELSRSQVHLEKGYPESNTVFFGTELPDEAMQVSYRANLETSELVKIASSPYGAVPLCTTSKFEYIVVADDYSIGDTVLFLTNNSVNKPILLYGKPLDTRLTQETTPLNGINGAYFVNSNQGLLLTCAVFDDRFGLAYLDLKSPGELEEIKVIGLKHKGEGELVSISPGKENHWLLEYNIDGCSWLYEGEYLHRKNQFKVTSTLVGDKQSLTGGMLESYHYDSTSGNVVASYSTAISPTQIVTIEGKNRDRVVIHTRERVLGIASNQLSSGEDASFISYDGTRVSARLYLPSTQLGFSGPRPLVLYVHGGPQSQERPDFAWFSMPLIQFLCLNGFAVFVPNVRGSTGYGLKYTKQVDRDWGGKDLDDHVFALGFLSKDRRVDVKRAGVVGRSYGGYMTLMLAGKHPALWSAAVDMFGPFDLMTFLDRIPETWKPYYKIALGDATDDKNFLIERSPKSLIGNIECPLLVIQGKNDPRVVEPESRDLVDYLLSKGKSVEYLMFENEGHDVLKYDNRVRCYSAITEFFVQALKP